MNDARRFASAAARNREPILRVLERFLPRGASVVEIASGTGEHAVYLAPRLHVARWQPSDPDAGARASIDAWRAYLGDEAATILPAVAIDVSAPPPRVDPAGAVVCINMIHIAPWEACLGLLDFARETLVQDVAPSPPGAPDRPGFRSLLYLYGPFRRGGAHTAPSNEEFDRSLTERNPAWGVRDLEAVTSAAEARGFALVEVVPMPANNLSVVLSLRP